MALLPDEDLDKILDNAVKVVANSNIMDFWAENKSRNKSLVEMVDALYHLCTLKNDFSYRQLLAKGILIIEKWKIGLPPSVLEVTLSHQKYHKGPPAPLLLMLGLEL